MIYYIIIDRSEVAHVMPVVRALQAMGEECEHLLGPAGRSDTVLCVGDRIDLLRYIAGFCPRAKICHLGSDEETGDATDDTRYRAAIRALAYLPMPVSRYGAPCLEEAALRVQEAKERSPRSRPYVVFSYNAYIGSTEREWERAYRATCAAARDRGWLVYATAPNAEVRMDVDIDSEPNSIAPPGYAVGPEEYHRLIAGAELMVGNSSSGIVEAPSLGTQTINVGPRQDRRARASSILDVPVDCDMRVAFGRALLLGFERKPYETVDHPAQVCARAVREVARCER